MSKLPQRTRPNVIPMPTPQSVGPIDADNGPRHKAKKKASPRTKYLNTLVTEDLHQSLRQASVRLGRSMGVLIEEAWAVHPDNPDAKK